MPRMCRSARRRARPGAELPMDGSPDPVPEVTAPPAPRGGEADGRELRIVAAEPADPDPMEERRTMLRRGLRRMRTVATLLLLLMTAIFVATTMTKLDWAWIPYLRAFAEAGMVGACADWFAVVALFRRPLGLPIPHTGIIPNNKERIGGALGRFMTNNFLTAPVLNERLGRVDIVGAVARWLGRSAQFGAARQLSRRAIAADRRGAARSAHRRNRRQARATGARQCSGGAGGVEASRHRLGARRGAGADRASDRHGARLSGEQQGLFQRQDRASNRPAGFRNGSTRSSPTR